MEDLFERFVAAVFRRSVEDFGGTLESQSGIRITLAGMGKSPIYGIPDLMVCTETGNKVVLDTKYKDPGYEGWKKEDIHQIVCYSAVVQSPLGVLIYASPEAWSWVRKLVNVPGEIAAFSLPLNWSREEILKRLDDFAEFCLSEKSLIAS
jgi:5-methylcytosine-specific restriction endonuclease McrBC regulatory subunit McrC